jgi:hypothetical protein
LIANQKHPELGIGGDRLHGACHDWSRRVVATHRVQGYKHGLLLLFGRHDFAVLIIAAVGANVVRQNRLLAAVTVLDLHRLSVQMAPPFALAGVRGSSLGDSHDFHLPQNDRTFL